MTRQNFEHYALSHSTMGPIPVSRKYLMHSSIKADMRVLDAGCGDGNHLEYVFKQLKVPKANLCGTEISQIRVERVRSKGYMCLKVDDVYLPFGKDSFDVVMLFEVIEHIPKEKAGILLMEISRVLKEGGRLIGSTPNYPAKMYYVFFSRIHARIKQIVKTVFFKKSDQEMNIDNLSEKYEKVLYNKDKKGGKPWMLRQIGRLFADDPTHVFFCNFDIIHKLGRRYFNEIKLFTTFGGEAKMIGKNSPKKYFSNKICFIYQK